MIMHRYILTETAYLAIAEQSLAPVASVSYLSFYPLDLDSDL
jgi:hypothetical protein